MQPVSVPANNTRPPVQCTGNVTRTAKANQTIDMLLVEHSIVSETGVFIQLGCAGQPLPLTDLYRQPHFCKEIPKVVCERFSRHALHPFTRQCTTSQGLFKGIGPRLTPERCHSASPEREEIIV